MVSDDILGFFGLPVGGTAVTPSSSSSTTRTTKPGKRKTNNAKNNDGSSSSGSRNPSAKRPSPSGSDLSHVNKQQHQRSSSTINDEDESESESSSDEEEELALAQLARPSHNKSKRARQSASATSAVIPVVSSNSNPKRSTALQTKPKTAKSSNTNNNKNPLAGSCKPTKQLGLHSFFSKGKNTNTKSLTTNKDASNDNDNDTTSSNAATKKKSSARSAMATSSSSVTSNDSYANKKRPHTFITAAEALLNNDDRGANSNTSVQKHSNRESNDDDMRHLSNKPKQKQQVVSRNNEKRVQAQDELEEFSDDESNNKMGNDAVNSLESQSEIMDQDTQREVMKQREDTEAGITKFLVKESKEKRVTRMRKRHNPLEFGIRNTIFGHKSPANHPRRKSKIMNKLFDGSLDGIDATEYLRSQQHSTKLLHGKSGVNILSTLFQRSILSSTNTRYSSRTLLSNKLQRFVQSGNHWNICDTVELATTNSGTNSTAVNNNNGEVCAMSFDRDGVLLATGDDRGHVRIYDFDDVYSEDVRMRNERCCLWTKQWQDVARSKGMGEGREMDDDDTGVVIGPGDSNEGEPSSADCGIVYTKEGEIEPPSIKPSLAYSVVSFQCRARSGGNVGPRISGIEWSPANQDHLAVSFANQQEVHIYDVASTETPLPCLRLGDSRGAHSRCSEGVLKATFLPPPSSSSSSSTKKSSGATQILTGGNYGTVRLWSISKPQQSRRGQAPPSISSLNTKCHWSISAFGSKGGEGVCDMLVLPSSESSTSSRYQSIKPPSSPIIKKPLVLLAGNASSLALLDTNKCTRKAFSTTVTPTIAASWDMYHLIQREVANMDSDMKLPARRWMAVHHLSFLGNQECTAKNAPGDDALLYKIGMVTKCGWILVAELRVSSVSAISTTNSNNINGANQTTNSNWIRLCIRIVHHTPRIQCFNSKNESLPNLGGMALHFSLPDIPIPSSSHEFQNSMIWLGDVKAQKYTMPSKDKFVLCEEYGTSLSSSSEIVSSSGASDGVEASSSSAKTKLHHPGEGLILARLDAPLLESSSSIAVGARAHGGDDENTDQDICARLPLSQHGSPLSLATHPNGEWMVISYGMNGRATASKPLELICLRKKC